MTSKQTDVASPLITTRPITRLYSEKLRTGRKKAGLTQKQAADAIGVDQAVISRWERGDKQPTVQYLMALAKTYGCKVSDLMPRNQYPSAPLDPEERQEWVWQRNARIQGVADVDATVKAWRDKRDKARERPSALPKEKP